ncbi:MAG: TetR/AcrR family transcriptional regulator [Gammaproteobacteria bacterium]|nr:TetR/AcrR family transcriptional regulator [Gammaproteobacteria bacterium]
MNKAATKAELKQTSITEAALDLFLRQGYAATSMDAVAAQSGVTKQTVYRYYPSKKELFTAVLESIARDNSFSHQFGEEAASSELEKYGRKLLAFHLTPVALGIYKLMLTEGNKGDLLKSFYEAGPQRWMTPLIQFIESRWPQLDDSQFHAQVFAHMILVPRNQLIMQGTKKIQQSEQTLHVRRVVDIFLNGLPITS